MARLSITSSTLHAVSTSSTLDRFASLLPFDSSTRFTIPSPDDSRCHRTDTLFDTAHYSEAKRRGFSYFPFLISSQCRCAIIATPSRHPRFCSTPFLISRRRIWTDQCATQATIAEALLSADSQRKKRPPACDRIHIACQWMHICLWMTRTSGTQPSSARSEEG